MLIDLYIDVQIPVIFDLFKFQPFRNQRKAMFNPEWYQLS